MKALLNSFTVAALLGSVSGAEKPTKASSTDWWSLTPLVQPVSPADLGRESRRATISFVGVGRAVAHHAAILDAIERRAAKTAAAAMQQHLKAATEDLLAKLGQKRKATT